MMHLKQVPQRKKHREHRVLFHDDSPFWPKKEEPKKGTYQRRPKHKGRDDGYLY